MSFQSLIREGQPAFCLAGRTTADKNGDFGLYRAALARAILPVSWIFPERLNSPDTYDSPGAKIRVNLGQLSSRDSGGEQH